MNKLPKEVAEISDMFCGCGEPEKAWQSILDRLEDSTATRWALPVDSGLDYILVYLLDYLKLTEHGTTCRFSWLTRKGEIVLKFLQEYGVDWEDKLSFVASDGTHYGKLE